MSKQLNQTWRLALSYLAIIMTMSILFSSVIYLITATQLGRPPKDQNGMQVVTPAELQAQFDARDAATRQSVFVSLSVLNGVVLVGGAMFSYFLARRTLRPIERAMEQQTQFVSDASHELRTPLAALLATNEVALRKKHIDDSKARVVLEKNIAEIEKLRVLSNNLLDLAKADRQVKGRAVTSTRVLVDRLIESLRPVADTRGIIIENKVIDREVTIHTDVASQVVSIFLDNALKYSLDNSIIIVSGDENHISVTDRGIGIAESEQAKVFERFYRADSARTRTGTSGHGLGLAIAKSLADSNGYSVQLTSQLNHGSTFTLRFNT